METNLQLLIVEDDDSDFMILERAFRSANYLKTLVRAADGVEALEYLRGENGREKLTQPFFVLCDVNMPRMDGLAFLREVRRDPELSQTIIFMLTGSSCEDAKQSAYELNIAGYLLKENINSGFARFMRLICGFSHLNQFR